jgi:hypothetical protein
MDQKKTPRNNRSKLLTWVQRAAWLAFKICQAKYLAKHNFSCHLVCNKKLPTSHIWLTKPMVFFCLTFALFVVKFCHAKDFASEN